MSLSQKYAGKVFVPWFNSAEWKHVYKILCSQSDKNYVQALYILKIWKCRTPLLSAGVEGTLILLEALLTEKKSLSDVQLVQIYSVSIMRFLNLSAANSEKQGTFHKMAVKNDLPKWLIDIRHDIAHDHKLPSISVLELGIRQCLEWIKVKYWQVQSAIIRDYIVTDSLKNSRVIEILEIYTDLNLKLFSKNLDISEYDEDIIQRINSIIYGKVTQLTTDISDIINMLEEYLNENLDKSISESDKERASKILVNSLLSIETEVNEIGTHVIPRDFRNIWSNLLDTLNENDLLPIIFDKLIDTTNNVDRENTTRETAALWISELLVGLQKAQLIKEQLNNEESNASHLDKVVISKIKAVLEKQCPEFEDCLEFSPTNDLCDGMKFQDKMLSTPNNYTLLFLEKALRFNKYSENYITDTVDLVKKMLAPSSTQMNEQIFTVDDLEDIAVPKIVEKTIDSNETIVADVNVKIANLQGTRWRRLKGTAMFKNCPLGVLPYQSRNKNPLLAI